MTTSRRNFLIGGLSAGAAIPTLRLAPPWLRAAGPTGKKLVVIQIRGGWDYMSLLPKSDHPKYVAARPNLRIPRASALTVQTGLDYYWHPSLQGLKALLDRGDLAVIHNIGYPNPNLSHFESEKKWYAADPQASVLQNGWLSRYLTLGYQGGFSIPAIDVEGRLSGAFSGSRVPVLTSVEQFQFAFDPRTPNDNGLELATLRGNGSVMRPTTNPDLQLVGDGVVSAVDNSALLQTVGRNYQPAVTYPASALAQALQLAARYIIGGLQTETYYTSTGGFDLHANAAIAGNPTAGNLANLLANFANSLKAFLDDVKAQGRGGDVVVMVFTEFARRFGENGSLGTDHGHGGVAFLAGEPVVGGLYGSYPDLDAATQPYNNYWIPFNGLSTDFRSLYATVLERVLNTNHVPILGSAFPLIPAL